MVVERTEANLSFRSREAYKHTPSLMAKSNFFYIQSAGHFYCAAEYYTRREGYQSFLLLYTVKGKGYVNYRGRHYEINPGQSLFIDCEEYQEYYTDKDDLWEMKWVHFRGCSSEGYFKMIYDHYGPVIRLNETSLIPGHIDSIIEFLKNENRQLEVASSGLMMQMLTEILLSASQTPENNKHHIYNNQVEMAMEYIEQNYRSAISLKDMANVANCSIYHFIRIFKKATGYSPYEYLIKYRINKAKSLLSSTFQSIEQISESVGFDSPSNFSKTFKQIEELTPVKYRKFWLI